MRSLPLLSPALLLLAVLLPAAAASGSEIHSGSALENWPKGPGEVVGYLVWTAAAGEANAAELRIGAASVAVHDSGAPITPGPGCAAAADGWVECGLPPNARSSVTVDLGDGDDTLRSTDDDRGSPFATTVQAGAGDDRVELLRGGAAVDGGAGDDVLLGGPQADQLAGGPSADRLAGGGGDDDLTGDPYGGPYAADELDGGDGARDVASYASRPGGVVVDLAAGSGGRPGEGDLLRGIEDAVGGAGADVLRGDDGPNRLVGWATSGPQPELLDGRGGDDLLHASGAAGPVRYSGGDGDDTIEALGRGSVDAGAGDDTISGGLIGTLACGAGDDGYASDEQAYGRAVVTAGCERVDTSQLRFSALRLLPRRLTFVVGRVAPASDVCAVRLRLRLRTAGAGRGRVLATQTLRLSPDGVRRVRRRTARFARAGGLPARVRIESRALYCEDPGRLRPFDGDEDQSFPLQREPLATAPASAG